MYRRTWLRSSTLAFLAPGFVLTACGGSDDSAPDLPVPAPSNAHLLSSTPSSGDPVLTVASALVADDAGGAWLIATRKTAPDCGAGVLAVAAPDLVLTRVDLATGQWSASTTLQTAAVSSAQLVPGRSGAMLLVYRESQAAGARTVWRRFSPTASAWGQAVPLEGVGAVAEGSMALRSTPSGDAILGWTEPADGGGQSTAHAMRFDAERQAWQSVQTVGSSTSWTNSGRSGLVLDASGRAIWLSGVGVPGGSPLTAWHNVPGDDAWHPVVLPAPGAGRLSHGVRDIGIDGQGNALVIWLESDSESASPVRGQLMTARCAAGTRTWTVQAVPLEQFQEPRALSLGLQVDQAGNAWVLGNTEGHVYRYQAATDVWQRFNLGDIAPAASPNSGYPLYLDSRGNALLVGGYAAAAGEAPRVWWNRYLAVEGRWQGAADFAVKAPELADPRFVKANRLVSPWVTAGADGRVALVISESVEAAGYRCFGSTAARLWGAMLV